jgi:hypothetical protein
MRRAVPRGRSIAAFVLGAITAMVTLAAFAWRKTQAEAVGTGRGAGAGRHGTPPSPQAAAAGYETHDASARALSITMGIFTVSIGSAIGLMLLLLGMWHATDAKQQAAFTQTQRTRTPPPEPRLQADPFDDLARAHDREAAGLHGYAMIDAGTARIPIARAMLLMADHPLDTPAQAASPLDTGK